LQQPHLNTPALAGGARENRAWVWKAGSMQKTPNKNGSKSEYPDRFLLQVLFLNFLMLTS